ncbi:MAG: pyruvate kinase, partial [Desulfonatronovibrionaceae bacterium]
MHTKIIATIGPVSRNRSVIRSLVRKGVRIFRLNFSHGRAADFT